MNKETGQGCGGCAGEKAKRSDCVSVVCGLIVLFIVFGVTGVGLERLGNFFDVPAVAIVFGAILGGWLLEPGLDISLRSVKILLWNAAPDAESARQAAAFCLAGIGYGFLGGLLGTLIGVINMLSGGMDNIAVLTCGLAVALLTNVYPLESAFFLLALYFRARRLVRSFENTK